MQAIAAAKMGHTDSMVTFVDPATGVTENLVLPSALSTRVVNGRAELVASNGTVLATEGQVITLGGGGSPFAVCTVNGVNYTSS